MRTTEIAVFQYPDSEKPRTSFWDSLPDLAADSQVASEPSSPSSLRREISASLDPNSEIATPAVQEAIAFEAGRKQGVREGREQVESAEKIRYRAMEEKRVVQTAESVNRLVEERDRFLEKAEQDVVRLALAIAERVLRREAQIDPLLLLGAVRVALGQLAHSVHVRLRVPSLEGDLWSETISHIPNLRVKPEIIRDQAMEAGNCAIESELGSTDLGLSAQLHTIRHDLLDGPPGSEISSEFERSCGDGESAQ